MNYLARLCLIAAATLALPLVSDAQQKPVLPRSWELNARMVSLPPSDPGLLTVLRNCAGCAPVSLSTAADTVYELDDAQVDVAELKRLFTANPDAFVLVEVDKDFRHVTRVKMWAPQAMAR